MPMHEAQDRDILARIRRLEERVFLEHSGVRNRVIDPPLWIYPVTLFAGYSCYRGFDLPNHYYQLLFAALLTALLYHKGLLYHRGTFGWSMNPRVIVLLLMNFVVLSFLFKLVIGGGEPKPFSWFRLPVLEGGLTSFHVTWKEGNITQFSIPLTQLQTFFVLVVLSGAAMGLGILSSLAAFFLLVISSVTFVSFDWNWALPGMVSALVSFYVQGEKNRRDG